MIFFFFFFFFFFLSPPLSRQTRSPRAEIPGKSDLQRLPFFSVELDENPAQTRLSRARSVAVSL